MKNPTILFLVHTLFIAAHPVDSAAQDPVTWRMVAIPRAGEIELIFTASLAEGWHLYPGGLERKGAMPVVCLIMLDDHYTLAGPLKEESTPVPGYDRILCQYIGWYEGTAIFSQRIKLQMKSARIRGKIACVAGHNMEGLRNQVWEFSIQVPPPRKEQKDMSL